MNQKQKEYACERVESVKNLKLAEAKEKYTTKGTKLEFLEKVALIRKNEVSLKSDAVLDGMYQCTIEKAFDFSAFEKKDEVNQKSLNKATKQIQANAQAILDDIMLGDAAEALKAIKEFEELAL